MNRQILALVVLSLIMLFAVVSANERQQAMEGLKTRLGEVRSNIAKEEQDRYLAVRPPIYTYNEPFAAVRRHIVGADSIVRDVAKKEVEMVALQQKGAQLQIRYNKAKAEYAAEYQRERIRRTNQGLRNAAKGRRGPSGPSMLLRNMETGIRSIELQGMEIQRKVSAHAQRKAAMLKQEYDLRYKERVVHDLAIKARDMQITARYDAALEADSGLLFIAQYMRADAVAADIEKGMEANAGAIKLLLKAGHDDKTEGLEKEIVEADKRLTVVREKQQELVDNYFKMLEKAH